MVKPFTDTHALVELVGASGLVTACESLNSCVIRRISRTETPISFNPRVLANSTIGGAIGEFIRICSGVPTTADPAPLM